MVYILSSAFNQDNTLQGAQLIPDHVTLHNFGDLLHNNVSTSGQGKADAPYLHWVLNSMLVAGSTALLTTILGALAAYAFSRFRFKGRRMGMLTLLLIQMFPQFAAVAVAGGLFYLVDRSGGTAEKRCEPLPLDAFVKFVDEFGPKKPRKASKLDLAFEAQIKKSKG